MRILLGGPAGPWGCSKKNEPALAGSFFCILSSYARRRTSEAHSKAPAKHNRETT